MLSKLPDRPVSFTIPPIVLGLVFALFTHTILQAEELFPFCKELENRRNDRQGWAVLSEMISGLKVRLENQCETVPYEAPVRVAAPKLLNELVALSPGLHRSWHNSRIIQNSPPLNDSSMHGCAVVLNSHLENRLPTNVIAKRQNRRQESHWDGLIIGSVVIVNGGIEMEGYIRDSVVIASGPIKLDGYVWNSLVVSCDSGESQASIDVGSGYINKSILVGRYTKPGSARESVIFGAAETDDFRGTDVRDWSQAQPLLANLGKADVPTEPLQFLQEKKLVPIEPGPLVKLLLDSREQTQLQTLAQTIEELTLTNEQVEQLVLAATHSESDYRRIILYHAIRHTRDIQGRHFLIDALAKSSVETQIQFLDNLKNPAPFDIPILQAIFRQNENRKTEFRDGVEVDFCESFLQLAQQNWIELVTEWNANDEFGEITPERRRAVYDRRREESGLARHRLLVWIIGNAKDPNHRIRAFQSSMKTLWPVPTKVGTDGSDRQMQAKLLLGTSTDPKFTVMAVPVVANWIPPEEFFTHPSIPVRLAAISAIEKRLRDAWASPHGYHQGSNEIRILADVAENDTATEVRDAALTLTEKIRYRLSKGGK